MGTVDPATVNPAQLPGAFLFFTIKTPAKGTGAAAVGSTSFAYVAYDPNIDKNTKLKDLQARYLSDSGANLPYMERFSQISTTSASAWQGKESVTYGGVFGGPDPGSGAEPFRSQFSKPWPFLDKPDKPTSPIRDGVYVSYWNFGSSTGMHTSSIYKHFTKGAEVPYMWLQEGNKKNLVPSNRPFVQAVVSEVYLDWYATFAGKLQWSAEDIPTSIPTSTPTSV